MNLHTRWLALLAVTLTTSLQAFTDTNVDMKELAATQAALMADRPAPMPLPSRKLWVPSTAKALDAFRPIYHDGLPADGATRLAAAAGHSRLR